MIQRLPTLVVNDPRRSSGPLRSQRVPRIQKELGDAQVVWNLRTFAMHRTEFVDRGNRSRHSGACLLGLGVRWRTTVYTVMPLTEEVCGTSSSVKLLPRWLLIYSGGTFFQVTLCEASNRESPASTSPIVSCPHSPKVPSEQSVVANGVYFRPG